MKNNTLVGLAHIFLLCVLMMGCTHAQRIDEASEASGLEGHDVHPLLNREWVLESLGVVGSEESTGATVKITLEFDEDGRLHGSAGCNRYFGTFNSKSQNLLTAEPIGTTRMMCQGEIMVWENRYLKALQDVSSYKTESNRLTLFYDSDGKVLSFIQKDSQ